MLRFGRGASLFDHGCAKRLAGLCLNADDHRFAVGGYGTNHKVVIADVAAVGIKGRPRLDRRASKGDVAESRMGGQRPEQIQRPAPGSGERRSACSRACGSWGPGG